MIYAVVSFHQAGHSLQVLDTFAHKEHALAYLSEMLTTSAVCGNWETVYAVCQEPDKLPYPPRKSGWK